MMIYWNIEETREIWNVLKKYRFEEDSIVEDKKDGIMKIEL